MANVNLTDREFEQLSDDIYKVVRSPRVWLDAFPNRQLDGFGVKDYSYYKQHDMSAIEVSMTGSVENFGMGYLEKSTAYIPVFSKDIRIFRRDLEASRRWGQPMDTRLQTLMAAKMMAKLDTVPGLGISAPIDVDPFPQQVTDAGGTADWATIAVIQETVLDVVLTLRNAEHWGPYKAIMSPPLDLNLYINIANSDATGYDWLRKLITDGTYTTNQIANSDGTAFSGGTGTDNVFFAFAPTTEGQNNFEILVAKEPTVEETSGNGFDPQYKLYTALIHHAYRTDAGATFDAITDIGT